MAEPNYEIMAKGFLKAIKDYGDIGAERIKLNSEIFANKFKAKQNIFWKMQEQKAQNQETLNLMKQMKEQGIDGGMNEGTGNMFNPEARVGEGGKININYPTARDKEFSIKYHQARIRKKQEKGLPLDDQETKFTEMYPETGTTDQKKLIENKILSGTATQEEIARYKYIRKLDTEENLFPEESSTSSTSPATLTPPQQNMLNLYKQKYPGKSEENIISVMKKQGLL